MNLRIRLVLPEFGFPITIKSIFILFDGSAPYDIFSKIIHAIIYKPIPHVYQTYEVLSEYWTIFLEIF